MDDTAVQEAPASNLPPPWEDVADHFQKAFPDVPAEEIRPQYEHARQMRLARAAATVVPEDTGGFMRRKMLSGYSTIKGVTDAVSYGRAKQRYEAGPEATKPEDYQTIAEHEQLQGEDQAATETFGGKLKYAAAGFPAMVGEFAAGGALLKAGASALPSAAAPWLSKAAAQEAGVAIPKLLSSSVGKATAQGLTRTAAQTAVVPSMYAERWTNNNIEQGRDPLDVRGFPAAFGLGMIQTALLGTIGEQAGKLIPGAGVAPTVARLGAAGGAGVFESAAADFASGRAEDVVRAVAPKWVSLKSHYGTIGDMIDGKFGEAGKNAGVTFLTFMAFAGIHEPARQQHVADTFQALQAASAKKGLSAQGGARAAVEVGDMLANALHENPALTRQQALDLVGEMPDKDSPAAHYAAALAMTIPEAGAPPVQHQPIYGNQQGQEAAGGPVGEFPNRQEPAAPGKPPEAPPVAPEPQAVPTPTQAPQPAPAAKPEPPQTALDAIPVEQLRDIAKGLGYGKGIGVLKREKLLKKLVADQGEATVQALAEAAQKPPEAAPPVKEVPPAEPTVSPASERARKAYEQLIRSGMSEKAARNATRLGFPTEAASYAEPTAPPGHKPPLSAEEAKKTPAQVAAETKAFLSEHGLEEAEGEDLPIHPDLEADINAAGMTVNRANILKTQLGKMSLRKVGKKLGVSQETVRTRATEAIEALRKLNPAKYGDLETAADLIALNKAIHMEELVNRQGGAIERIVGQGSTETSKLSDQAASQLHRHLESEQEHLLEQLDNMEEERARQSLADRGISAPTEEQVRQERRTLTNAARQGAGQPGEVAGPQRGGQQPPAVRPAPRPDVQEGNAPGGPAAAVKTPEGATTPHPEVGAAPGGREAAGDKLIPPAILDKLKEFAEQGRALEYGDVIEVLKEHFDPEQIKELKKAVGEIPKGTKDPGRKWEGRGVNQQMRGGNRKNAARQYVEEQLSGKTGELDAQQALEESHAALVKYGFSESDLAQFEREAENLPPDQKWSHSLENLVSGFETGTDPNNPTIGNEQQMMREHLKKVIAAREGGDTSFDPAEFGETGKTIMDKIKELGTNQDGSLNLDRMKELWDETRKNVRWIGDGLAKMAGRIGPALTRASRTAGEAMARYIAAPGYAREAIPDYIDRVMPKDITEAERREYGAAMIETLRLRKMKQVFLQNANDAGNAAYDARQRAAAADARGDKDEAARQRKGAAELAKIATDNIRDRLGVTTLVGKAGYPHADEAALQKTLSDPKYIAVREAYKKEFVPKMNDNFRRAEGLDENDPINAPTQTEGYPINLMALQEGPPEPDQGVRPTRRGDLRNPKLAKYAFARMAKGNAEHYETDLAKIMENTLARGEKTAAKADFTRAMVNSGKAWFGKPYEKAEGMKEIPGVNPPKGTQPADPGQTSLYVPEAVYPEVRHVYQVDEPMTFGSGFNKSMTWGALASTVEAAYHSKNLLTMWTRPGMHPIDFLKNATALMRGDPEAQKQLTELARIGALKEAGGAGQGILWGGKTDPTAWMGKTLEFLQKTMRLTADDAFDRLVKRGVKDTDTNRRDFINQLGQYNRAGQAKIVQLFRDTGFGTFATAGTNYYMQGLRAITMAPGVEAGSYKQAVALRAEVLGRIAAVLGTSLLANYFMWKRVDGDESTPAGAIKVGEKDGKSISMDLVNFTGLTRGLRQTGLLALLEGARQGQPAGTIADRATQNAYHAVMHPFEGPGVSMLHTMATGENTIGMKVADKAQRGESQAVNNFQAALWNFNPVVAVGSHHDRAQKDAEKEVLPSWNKLLGPFGLKEHKRK